MALAAVVVFVVVSAFGYVRSRDVVPPRVRIAGGPAAGLYHRVSTELASRLGRRLSRPVDVLETDGSIENVRLVREGKAELGLAQLGTEPLGGLVALAPLYRDPVLVIVRAGSGITSVADLRGRPVAIGRPGSGVRVLGVRLLARYGVRGRALVGRAGGLAELADDPAIDAAVVITGLLSPDLARTLGTGEYEILAIDDAEAVAIHEHHLARFVIPLGAFSAVPRVPNGPISTVSATSVLVARRDASDAMVEGTLASLFESDLAFTIPTLVGRDEAKSMSIGPLHAAARRYHDPYEGMDTLSDLVQAVDAGKELLLALGAAVYLVVERLRRRRRRAEEQRDVEAGERLDAFLERAIALERAQIGVWDPKRLVEVLEEVTQVKIEALESLSRETLRSDRRFHIFLTQCANLIQNVHAKLEIGARHDVATSADEKAMDEVRKIS